MKSSGKIAVVVVVIVVCAVILAFGMVEPWPPVFVSFMPTTSMEPEIEAGDVFTIDRTLPFHAVNVGDVAVYWQDSVRISHKVVDRTDNYLLTKGHNPPWAEMESVTRDQYVGIVGDVIKIPVFNVLFDHLPSDDLMSDSNKPLLMVIVLLLGAVWFVGTYKRKRRSRPNAPV